MPDDPWVGEVSTASDYSVDKFYTASRNKKGFGSTVRVTVAPEVLAQISGLVASRQIAEYQTCADFFRDCMVHRLTYLQSQLKDGKEFSPSYLANTLRQVEQQERIAMEREAESRLAKLMRENLNNARDDVERVRAENAIRAAIATATPAFARELQQIIR